MTEQRLVLLVTRKVTDELDAAEREELEKWTAESTEHERFMEVFNNPDLLAIALDRYRSIDLDKGFAKVQALIDANRRSRLIRMTGVSAACTALAVAAAVLLSQLSTHRPAPVTENRNSLTTVPAATKSLKRDSLAGYKIATTRRAEQKKLTLPDGSHVWLNDSTTLRYPEMFSGSTRIVELTGEAYFEIAKDASRQFVVERAGLSVQVLGTSFDCSFYPGEMARIVLLKGTVNVKTVNESALLRPDEQATVKTDGSLHVDKHVPATSIASWKDGYFFFNRTPLDQVIRQLTRWYDISAEDRTGLSDVLYDGTIDRSRPLDSLLKILDNKQLKFQLKNRKLIVLSR